MTFHHSDVEGVARREQSAVLRDFAGSQNIRFLDSENLVDHAQDHLERRSDSFSFADWRVPMQNLPQHLCVGNQSLPRPYPALQPDLGLRLVRMCRTGKLHRDVGIDEEQA